MRAELHIPGYAFEELEAGGYVLGIDVSGHQGVDIDWHAVRASGVEFVIVKISEGADSTYTSARSHIEGARKAGLIVSVYHFATLYYDTGREDWDAISEAQATLDAIARYGLDSWIIPPQLDLEKWSRIDEKLSAGEVTTWAHAYMGYIHAHLGVMPGIYLSGRAFREDGSGRVLDRNGLEPYALWVADYTKSKGPIGRPRIPGDWASWTMHQFTSSGRVPGISGDVDMNVMRRSTLHRYCALAALRPLVAGLAA